jgi:chromate reductase
MNIVTICGSLRKASYNRMLMRLLPSLAPAGMNFKEAPPYDHFPYYNADLHADGKFPAPVTAFADAIRAADGIVIVTPEYNYTIPGALKNAIDWVSRMKDQPFKEKAIAIQSATQGPLGGGRMQYHMRTMFVFLEAFTFNRPEIFVGLAQNKFDDKGELTDEATKDFIKKQLEGFAKFVERVRA